MPFAYPPIRLLKKPVANKMRQNKYDEDFCVHVKIAGVGFEPHDLKVMGLAS